MKLFISSIFVLKKKIKLYTLSRNLNYLTFTKVKKLKYPQTLKSKLTILYTQNKPKFFFKKLFSLKKLFVINFISNSKRKFFQKTINKKFFKKFRIKKHLPTITKYKKHNKSFHLKIFSNNINNIKFFYTQNIFQKNTSQIIHFKINLINTINSNKLDKLIFVNLQNLLSKTTICSKSNNHFKLNLNGFLFSNELLSFNFSINPHNLYLLKKNIYSFSYKNEMQKFILKRYLKNKTILLPYTNLLITENSLTNNDSSTLNKLIKNDIIIDTTFFLLQPITSFFLTEHLSLKN
jgi:hypothetical protein